MRLLAQRIVCKGFPVFTIACCPENRMQTDAAHNWDKTECNLSRMNKGDESTEDVKWMKSMTEILKLKRIKSNTSQPYTMKPTGLKIEIKSLKRPNHLPEARKNKVRGEWKASHGRQAYESQCFVDAQTSHNTPFCALSVDMSLSAASTHTHTHQWQNPHMHRGSSRQQTQTPGSPTSDNAGHS